VQFPLSGIALIAVRRLAAKKYLLRKASERQLPVFAAAIGIFVSCR
jgi:hypothetical protein